MRNAIEFGAAVPAGSRTLRRFGRVALPLLVGMLAWTGTAALAMVPPEERAALLAIYDATHGDSWIRNGSHDSTVFTHWGDIVGNECWWYGVYCEGSWESGFNVTHLELQRNNLTGSLPSYIGLGRLRRLWLFDNALTGSIPSLAGLPALEELYVTGNGLSGPLPSFAGLKALREVLAYENQLTGPIPDLSGLTSLRYFTVDTNRLSGNLPSLSGLKSLIAFSAYGNQLTGPIPSLAGLTALEYFKVDNNQLSGGLPSLAGLTALIDFRAHRNRLTGTIPPFGALPKLQVYAASYNQLTGPIPALDGLTGLQQFYVGSNQLTGPMPAAPATLLPGNSYLCANALSPSGNAAVDAAWRTATGGDWLTCQLPTLTCAQVGADPHSPLTFTCTLLDGGKPLAKTPIYYKLRTSNSSGVALNAFNALLSNAYHSNDSDLLTGGDDAAGTLISGVTDAAGVSKIRTFVDFGKMAASFPPNWFPTLRSPLTVTVQASTARDFAVSARSAQFDLLLDSLGAVDQVWVAEGPGCFKPIDCTPAVSTEPNPAQRRVALDTYRARTKDATKRLVVRGNDLGEREFGVGEKFQSGDVLKLDANAIVPTFCPSCYRALLADGSPAPGYVFAKLSFWDGVKALLGVDSSASGTWEFGMGTLALSTAGTVDRLSRWGRAKVTEAGPGKAVEWAATTMLPKLTPATKAKDFVEWTVAGIEAAESFRRTTFVVLNSEVYARSVPGGVSTLTTIEGEAVLYPETSDASLGTVSGGRTAEYRVGQATPTIRATTAEEARAAYDRLGMLTSGCSAETILHDNTNTGACSLGNTAAFNLAQASSVSRLAVWYNTEVGGSSLRYTLQGPDRSVTGTFVPVGCDTHQSQWCMGEAPLNQLLGAGTYTITTAAGAVCRNAASGNVGFSVIHGCAAPANVKPAVNYQGLWWTPAESGWGINFAHQGDTIFATWFIYDDAGRPWWLIAELHLAQDGASYTGAVSRVVGEPFNTVPWDSSRISEVAVGTMTAIFTSPSTAILTYTVTGATQEKSIVKQAFGTLPTCSWGTQSDLGAADNYTDLWWNAGESGWGVNFSHQDDVVFATWFTYDGAGNPWWLIAELRKTAAGRYAGPVATVRGSAFIGATFDPSRVAETTVGSAAVTFANGNSANFEYSVNGVTQAKAIARQVFRAPGTACR